MPNHFLTASTVTTGIRADMGADASAFTYVAQGVTVGTTGNALNSTITGTGADQTVTVEGSVWNQLGSAISLTGLRAEVSVAQDGRVASASPTGFAAVALQDAARLANAGEIEGQTRAVAFGGAGGTAVLMNSGTIRSLGTSNGTNANTGATVFLTGNASLDLTNAGLIEAGYDQGTDGGPYFNQFAIRTGGTATGFLDISNSGTIRGNIGGGSGVQVSIDNSGLIDGSIGVGPTGRINLGSLVNTGTITGALHAGALASLPLIIENHGRMLGAVNAANEAATIRNTGFIARIESDAITQFDIASSGEIGEVRLGWSDDRLDLRGGGFVADDIIMGLGSDTVLGGEFADVIYADGTTETLAGGGNDWIRAMGGDDTVYGGTGADGIIGGDGNDEIFGGEGNDALRGQLGQDAMSGGDGNDDINGGAGDDILFGDGGLDTLAGGAGDDQLFGGASADTLRGGAGDDTLTGGAGSDRMSGESGADTFVFAAVSDSVTGNARDRIVDFTTRDDKIDLSAIDANTLLAGKQIFSFIAAAAFSGTAGELRYAGGILRGDVNGDTVADFELQLIGAPVLVAADLILQ